MFNDNKKNAKANYLVGTLKVLFVATCLFQPFLMTYSDQPTITPDLLVVKNLPFDRCCSLRVASTKPIPPARSEH